MCNHSRDVRRSDESRPTWPMVRAPLKTADGRGPSSAAGATVTTCAGVGMVMCRLTSHFGRYSRPEAYARLKTVVVPTFPTGTALPTGAVGGNTGIRWPTFRSGSQSRAGTRARLKIAARNRALVVGAASTTCAGGCTATRSSATEGYGQRVPRPHARSIPVTSRSNLLAGAGLTTVGGSDVVTFGRTFRSGVTGGPVRHAEAMDAQNMLSREAYVSSTMPKC